MSGDDFVSTLSVVIPALNEQDGIGEIVSRVLSIEPRLRQVGIPNLELIVVDDGSDDGTADVVASFPQVCLVRHPTNLGYGAALKTGFYRSSGELLAFLDADGTYPPEYLPELCREVLDKGADLAIGSRMLGKESRMPRVRRMGNKLFAGLLSLVGNAHITDSSSGMRVLRREALACLYPLPDGLHFTPTMSTRALHEQLTMVEVPIPYEERVGSSKLSALRDGTRFLHTILWTALSYNPVRILGLAGMAAIGLAGAVGVGLVVARLRGITNLGQWGVFGVFAALVLAVSGASLFSLGATFNYLVSLFHKQPVRQGLFGKPIFHRPLDRHFGWMGLATGLVGLMVGVASLVLGINGWPESRLWLYQLGSASLILVGVQLAVSWVIMRVLEELSQREALSDRDRTGNGQATRCLQSDCLPETYLG